MSVTPVNPQMEAALRRAAAATGTDFAALVETARRESGFDPKARAATSSASGLFQFVEQTWLETLARHGAKHGRAQEAAQIDLGSGRARVVDPEARAALLALRFDPELSARMAGELARSNAESLERALGRSPSTGEVYAAHVMGAGGAAQLIRAAEAGAGDAAALFPQAAAANRGLFYDRSGAPVSTSALLARLAGAGAVAGPGSSAPLEAPASDAPVDASPAAPERQTLPPALFETLLAFAAGLGGEIGEEAARPAPELAMLRAAAFKAFADRA